MATAPVPRLDGAALQINNLLHVFAGYGTIDYVHSHVDIYNVTDNTWGGRFDMPKQMAHSHLGMVTDSRYIYIVNRQYGPQCRGPTAYTFALIPTPSYGGLCHHYLFLDMHLLLNFGEVGFMSWVAAKRIVIRLH